MALATTSAPFQQVNMPALDLRRFLSALMTEGVVGSSDMAVAQRGAGANMSVDIAAGQAVVTGESITNQGSYYAYNDATFNLTGFSAANATNPRIDRVALKVRDAFQGDAANDLAFVIVTGTATAGATLVNLTGAAAVPANHLLLANVLIPATATSITTANIDTTVRTFAAGLLGGTEITTVSSAATTGPTGVTVTSSGGDLFATFPNATYAATKYHLELMIGGALASTTVSLYWGLFDSDGTTGLTNWQGATLTTAMAGPFRFTLPFTPTAGTRRLQLRFGSGGAGTFTVSNNNGGTLTYYARIVKA